MFQEKRSINVYFEVKHKTYLCTHFSNAPSTQDGFTADYVLLLSERKVHSPVYDKNV